MTISLLQRREIEARVVGPIVRAFAAEIGEERARAILAGVVRELATLAGRDAATAIGDSSIAGLNVAVDSWQQGGALSLDVLEHSDSDLDFNVTRCQYAEMYQRLGMADLGPILSCSRDGAMIEGFNPGITLERTQTLMEGASHCDFRFHSNK